MNDEIITIKLVRNSDRKVTGVRVEATNITLVEAYMVLDMAKREITNHIYGKLEVPRDPSS